MSPLSLAPFILNPSILFHSSILVHQMLLYPHHQTCCLSSSFFSQCIKQVNRTLEELDLRDNKITHFPIDWCFTNSILTTLYLDGNPIRSPPMHVCGADYDDPKTLRAFINDLRASGGERTSEVRVMLVGHGGAGKTTMKNRIVLNRPCLPTGVIFDFLFLLLDFNSFFCI